MKSLFSRRNDQQTGQSKTKDSYKFWRSEQSSSKTASNQLEPYAVSRSQAESRTKRSTPKPSQPYSNTQDRPPAPPPEAGAGSSAEQIVYPSTRINTVPLPSANSQQLPPLPPPRPPTSSRHREFDDVKPQPQLRSFTTPVYGAPSSHVRQEQTKGTRYPHSRNDVATIVRREVWLPPPHASSTSRPPEGKEERTREPVLSEEPERYRSSTEDRGVSRDPTRRDRERERTRDRERDRVRDREPDRDRIRRPTEREETPRDRDLQRQRDAALERARELEREQARDADRAREKEERELERAKEREREAERERQKQREREAERAKEREVERERQRQRVREEERVREREMERERQRQREREEERTKERQREVERERQKLREREEERVRERHKEVERERQMEREKEREREAERERQKEREEKEREREVETERQKERERELERAKERERETERERQREREMEMEKERERERQVEREREKQLEREKERERERAKEIEKEKERERQRERERDKDRERREQREKARQIERERRDRERELYERERLRRERDINAEAGTSTKEATPNGPGPDQRPSVVDPANDRERSKKEDSTGRTQTRQFDQAVATETGHGPAAPSYDDFRREKATRERHRPRERERDPDQARYRAEATDVEPERYRSRAHGDRDRRRESRSGWVSDNYAGLSRKASRQIRQDPPQVDEAGDTSDGSINRAAGLPKLRRRDRMAEATVAHTPNTAQYGRTPSMQPKLLPAYTTPQVMPFHLPTADTRNNEPTPRNPTFLPEASRGNEGDGTVRREINRHKLQEDPRNINEPHNVIEQPQRPSSRASMMHGSSSTQFLPFSAPFGNAPSSSQPAQRFASNAVSTFSGSNNMFGNGSKENLPTRKLSEELRPSTTGNTHRADSVAGNIFETIRHEDPLGENRDRKPYGHLTQPSGEFRYPSLTPKGHSRIPSDDQKEMQGVSETHASMSAAPPLAIVVQPSTRHVERVKPSPPFPSNTLQTPSITPRALADDLAARATADGFRQVIASAPSHGMSTRLTTQSSAPPQLHPAAAHSKATTVVPDFPLFLTGILPGGKPAGKDVVQGVFSPPSHSQALYKPIAAPSVVTGEQKQTMSLSQESVHPSVASAHKTHQSDPDPLNNRNRQDAKVPEQANLWAPTVMKSVEAAANQQTMAGSSIQRPSTRNQNVRVSVLQPPSSVTGIATSQLTTQSLDVSKSQPQPNVTSSMRPLIFPPDATPPNPFLNEPHQRQEHLPTWNREPLQEETGHSVNRPATSMGSRRDLLDTRAGLPVSLGQPAFRISAERFPHTAEPMLTSNVSDGRGQPRDLATNTQVGASVEQPGTSMGSKRDHHDHHSHRPTGSGDRHRDITTVALSEHPTSSQERLQQEKPGPPSSRPPTNNGSKQGYAAGIPLQPIRQSLEPRTTDLTASQDVGTPAVRPSTTNGLKRVPLSSSNVLPPNIEPLETQPWPEGPSVQPHIVVRPPTASGHRKEHATTALRRSEAPSNNVTSAANHVREPAGGFSTALPVRPLPQMEESSTQRHHRANNIPVPNSSKSHSLTGVDHRVATQWKRQVVQEDTTPPSTGQIPLLAHNSQVAPVAGIECQPTAERRLEERVQYPVQPSAPHDSPKFRQRVENTPLVHNHALTTVDDQHKIPKEETTQHRADSRGHGEQVTRSSPLVQALAEVREEPRLRKQDNPKITIDDHTSIPHVKAPGLQNVDSTPQIKIHRPSTAMGHSANSQAILETNVFDKPRYDALLAIGPSPQSSRKSNDKPSSAHVDNLVAIQAPPRYSPLFKGNTTPASELHPLEAIAGKKMPTIPIDDAIHRTPPTEPIPPVLQENHARYARSSPQAHNAQIIAQLSSGYVNEGGSRSHQRNQNAPRARESPEQRVEVEVDHIKPTTTNSDAIPQARTEAELLCSARPALQTLPANQSEIERAQTPFSQKIHHPKLAELLSSPPSSQPFTLKPGMARSSENTRNNFPIPSATSNGYPPPTIVNDAARSSPPEKVKDVLKFEPRQREMTTAKTVPISYSQSTSGQPRSMTVNDTSTQPTSTATKARANLILEPTAHSTMQGAAIPKLQPSVANKPSQGYTSTRSASQPLDIPFGVSSQSRDNIPPAPVTTRSHPRHHQHSSSLPMNLPPSSGASFEPARSSTPAVAQSQPPQLLSLQTNSHDPTDKRKLALPTAPSEETILMTPSSLGQTSVLKPTTSRQSTTPSVKSQTAKKGFLDRFRRSSTPAPAVQAQQFQVWHPNASASTPEGSPGHRKRPESPEVETKITPPSPPPNPKAPISIEIPVRDRVHEPIGPAAQVFNPFNYLTKRRNYGVDNASMEARDGATSTIIGSPTASLLSAVAVQLPPNRDTRQATSEWLSNEEVHIQTRPKRRRHRPGVVIEAAEDPPENKQRPKRNATRYKRPKGSSKPPPSLPTNS